jgi:uncharacterized protein (DUF952 family)
VAKVYKIIAGAEWERALALGRFEGAAIDLTDCYIHLSTAAQAQETARRHFAGQAGLVLLRVDAASLGAALKWEPSRGGDLFPHLYGALDCRVVEAATTLPLSPDGVPEIGDLPP